jgi:hypothetical protein
MRIAQSSGERVTQSVDGYDVAPDCGILIKCHVKFGVPASKSARSSHGFFCVVWLLHGAAAHIRGGGVSRKLMAGFYDSKTRISPN